MWQRIGYVAAQMKTYATYGLAGALLGALQTLVLFFLGFHGERAHLLNDWKVSVPLGVFGFGLGVAVIVLGLRAWREASPNKAMSYGRGVGGGTLIGLWQGLGSAAFLLLYGLAINPGFKEAMVANQMAQLRAKGGIPAEGYAMAENMLNITLSPVVQAVGALVGSVVLGTIVALVAAAVLRREATEGFASEPPAAGGRD
ncbi:MAG: DUF4199 domain-containing protein [Opitutaceae bacterium]|nr:DUF4199 domain-containing protein [Opitutaceae bacterium]